MASSLLFSNLLTSDAVSSTIEGHHCIALAGLKCYISGSQPVGCHPFDKPLSPKIFTIHISSKITVMSSDENNFMIGITTT